MDLHLVTQPYADSTTVVDFLRRLTRDPAIRHLDIVVAWAKRSGFAQVEAALRQFTARGGTIRIITGISGGRATKQGLHLVQEIATQAFVFHHPSRTFHPKMYVGQGDDIVSGLVGSQNLTRGGLVNNFEVGLAFDAVPSREQDRSIVQAVEEHIEALVADEALCRPLDDETLRILVTDPQYRVGDENTERSSREPDEPVSPEPEIEHPPEVSIFGTSKFDLT